MRTRWPGFAAFHSGHVAVVEFISAVWRRLRSFARCVERHPAADPLADAVSRRPKSLDLHAVLDNSSTLWVP
jgi:hypothetical protein